MNPTTIRLVTLSAIALVALGVGYTADTINARNLKKKAEALHESIVQAELSYIAACEKLEDCFARDGVYAGMDFVAWCTIKESVERDAANARMTLTSLRKKLDRLYR